MSMLNHLQAIKAKSKKRVGRGYGSTKGGHTSGRGTKGQLSRTGSKVPLWFEGGALPLVKRLPMLRGKGRLKAIEQIAILRLDQLKKFGKDQISLDTLKLHGLVAKKTQKVKVVASGTLDTAVSLVGIQVTKKAQEMIEKAGGKVL